MCETIVVREGDALRRVVETFIRNVYAAEYGAQLQTFPPRLFALTNERAEIMCAAGVRLQEDGFFSEIYLDSSIEQELCTASKRTITRNEIFEVTTFASRAPRVTMKFIKSLGLFGEQNGFASSFFTLTQRLHRLVERFSPERAAFSGVLLNLGGVVGALIISIAVRRTGPYWPVIVALCFGSVLVWLVGQRVGAGQGLLPLVFLAGAGVFGAQLAMPAIAAGLFPLEVRGAGVGWAMGVGRTASIVAPLIGGALIAAQIPWPTLFLIVAVPVLVAALAVFLVNRENPGAVP
jgi:hypothetical protein